jgi:hypothetical protein
MKKFGIFLLILLCISLLWVPASAASGVESVRTEVLVQEDGSCSVAMRITLRLEQGEKLEIPLPQDAQDVRLGGKFRTPTQQGGRLVLPLPELEAGVHVLEVSYTLANAVMQKSTGLLLNVPLLTGLSYPVERFSFAVTLPAPLTGDPSFFSGYYGESIAPSLQVQVQGNTVSGACTVVLKDHETLRMNYLGTKEMFPRFSAREPLLSGWEMVMAGLMAAAILYYLVALLPMIPRKIRSFSPPEGLAAGDLGTCLTGCGMDLTMMVFSWAQLGYLEIETDRKGNVWLHKRMEMGSERNGLEIRCFQVLFREQQTVNGLGLHYARLCRKMATKSHLLKQIYRSRSGNPRIVRALAVAAGACGGVLMSQGVYTAGAGTVFLALGMALACSLLSYGIQSGSKCLPLGNRLPIWAGFGCALAWLGLGVLMHRPMLAALLVGYELVMGLAAAVGGRRSEIGQQYVAQIRGLRSHLTRASVFDMQQCLEKNPAYFFELMPYALALGVERSFARRFGKVTVPECSYLIASVRGELTPLQWAGLLRQVADRLNRRQRRLKYEQLFNTTEHLVKSK